MLNPVTIGRVHARHAPFVRGLYLTGQFAENPAEFIRPTGRARFQIPEVYQIDFPTAKVSEVLRRPEVGLAEAKLCFGRAAVSRVGPHPGELKWLARRVADDTDMILDPAIRTVSMADTVFDSGGPFRHRRADGSGRTIPILRVYLLRPPFRPQCLLRRVSQDPGDILTHDVRNHRITLHLARVDYDRAMRHEVPQPFIRGLQCLLGFAQQERVPLRIEVRVDLPVRRRMLTTFHFWQPGEESTHRLRGWQTGGRHGEPRGMLLVARDYFHKLGWFEADGRNAARKFSPANSRRRSSFCGSSFETK